MKKQGAINIIIVDDHRLFNDGLNMMLQAESDINVLDQVYDSRDAVQKTEVLNPDVVLIDFNMPHINGIELTHQLLQTKPDLKMLILSMYNEEIFIEKFKKAGIKGYLFKTASAEEVVQPIKNIYDNESHFTDNSSKSIHSDDDFLKKLKLSKREIEVINLVKEGLTTKEIAEKLNISFYTAETHRKNIKVKMGIKGEADFIKFAYGQNKDF